MDPIRSVDELGQVVAGDARFADYRVTGRDVDMVEVRAGEKALVIAGTSLWREPSLLRARLHGADIHGTTLLVLAGHDEELQHAERLREQLEFSLLHLPVGRARLFVTLKSCFDLLDLRARALDRGQEADRFRYELGELIAIARAISSERDIDKLLGLILEKSRYITGADAGSVYVVEGDAPDPRDRTLRFMVSQNDSVDIDFREFTLHVDERSVAGRAVIAREPINIPDLRQLGDPGRNPWGLQHDGSFDRRSGYQARSMLTVPMVNQRDEVIGVIQLINKRRDGAPRLHEPRDFDQWVIPFDERSRELAATLAAQAGISLENTILYADIQRLFEGFVSASVTAIESRDPTTSGHSQRVATLTVGLAEVVDREERGPYADIRFTRDDIKQLEYAGLLHDFGKVGVREKVLVKARKLYDWDRDAILSRFDYIRKSIEADALREKLRVTEELSGAARREALLAIDVEAARKGAELDAYTAVVLDANEPSILLGGVHERLAEIAERTFTDARGSVQPFLRPSEVLALRLARGSLTAEERREIESHVVHTFHFLETIPWGRRFGRIPAIAGAHHEKLDGTGYPRGLRAADIRVETRMMTISDIFDALTAGDRPYKKSMPVDAALDVLDAEVRAGRCDADLFRLFVDARVWRRGPAR